MSIIAEIPEESEQNPEIEKVTKITETEKLKNDSNCVIS